MRFATKAYSSFRLYDFSCLCRLAGAQAGAAAAAPPQSSHACFLSSWEGPRQAGSHAIRERREAQVALTNSIVLAVLAH